MVNFSTLVSIHPLNPVDLIHFMPFLVRAIPFSTCGFWGEFCPIYSFCSSILSQHFQVLSLALETYSTHTAIELAHNTIYQLVYRFLKFYKNPICFVPRKMLRDGFNIQSLCLN